MGVVDRLLPEAGFNSLFEMQVYETLQTWAMSVYSGFNSLFEMLFGVSCIGSGEVRWVSILCLRCDRWYAGSIYYTVDVSILCLRCGKNGLQNGRPRFPVSILCLRCLLRPARGG